LKDPLLVEIQNLLNELDADVPWTTAVISSAINYTTIEDRRRRCARDVKKTGNRYTLFTYNDLTLSIR
jgi:hypothetical protein